MRKMLGVMMVAVLAVTMVGATAEERKNLPSLVESLNDMPRNFWPMEKEQDIRATSRNDWLKRQLQISLSSSAAIKVSKVEATELDKTVNAVRETQAIHVKGVAIYGTCTVAKLWGEDREVQVCTLVEGSRERASEVKEGDTANVSGAVVNLRVSSTGELNVTLRGSFVIPKPPATAPAKK